MKMKLAVKLITTLTLAFILFCGQVVFSPQEAAAAQPSIILSKVKGEVFIKKGGGLRELPAENGMELVQGDWLRTGKNGTAKLSYEDGTEATVGSNSSLNIQRLTRSNSIDVSGLSGARVTFSQDGQQSSVQLQSGSIWSKVKSLFNMDDSYEVETPTAVMGVRGTLYLVSVNPDDGSTQGDVVEGVVGVTQNNEAGLLAPIQLVTMGQTLRLVSLEGPLPEHQVIDPQELIKNTQPEILVQLINDIAERTKGLTELTSEQRQAYEQTGAIEHLNAAIGTSFKSDELASFGKDFINALKSSEKLEAIKQVLTENKQTIEQLQSTMDSLKTETEDIKTEIEEKAKEAGVSAEQIQDLQNQATGAATASTLPATSSNQPPATQPTTNNGSSNNGSNNSGNQNVLIGVYPIAQGVPISFSNGVSLDFGNMNIPEGARVKVEEVSSTNLPASSPVAGKIVKFTFEGIDMTSTVTLALPLNPSANTEKVGIYYLNGTNWEYQDSEVQNGKVIALVSHFSTYGVLEDTIPPVITLKGSDVVELAIGETYYDESVTIWDNLDKVLSPEVTYAKDGVQVNNLDTTIAGTYVIHYNVRDAVGNSAKEVTRTVNVLAKLDAPTGLQAYAGNGFVVLNWNSVTGATNYKVYQSVVPNGQYHEIYPEILKSDNYFIIDGLTNETAYYFKVRASDGLNDSLDSQSILATPKLVKPGTVFNLKAVAGDQEVKLSWDNELGATFYKVFYSTTSGGPYTEVEPDIVKTDPSYTVNGLINSQTYYFIVQACNDAGDGEAPDEVSAKPIAGNSLVMQINSSGSDPYLYEPGDQIILRFDKPIAVDNITVNELNSALSQQHPSITFGTTGYVVPTNDNSGYASEFSIKLGTDVAIPSEGLTFYLEKEKIIDELGTAAIVDVGFTIPNILLDNTAIIYPQDDDMRHLLNSYISGTLDNCDYETGLPLPYPIPSLDIVVGYDDWYYPSKYLQENGTWGYSPFKIKAVSTEGNFASWRADLNAEQLEAINSQEGEYFISLFIESDYMYREINPLSYFYIDKTGPILSFVGSSENLNQLYFYLEDGSLPFTNGTDLKEHFSLTNSEGESTSAAIESAILNNYDITITISNPESLKELDCISVLPTLTDYLGNPALEEDLAVVKMDLSAWREVRPPTFTFDYSEDITSLVVFINESLDFENGDDLKDYFYLKNWGGASTTGNIIEAIYDKINSTITFTIDKGDLGAYAELKVVPTLMDSDGFCFEEKRIASVDPEIDAWEFDDDGPYLNYYLQNHINNPIIGVSEELNFEDKTDLKDFFLLKKENDSSTTGRITSAIYNKDSNSISLTIDPGDIDANGSLIFVPSLSFTDMLGNKAYYMTIGWVSSDLTYWTSGY